MQVITSEDVKKMQRLLEIKQDNMWFPLGTWKSGEEECTTFCQYSSKYDNLHIASCLSKNLRYDVKLDN